MTDIWRVFFSFSEWDVFYCVRSRDLPLNVSKTYEVLSLRGLGGGEVAVVAIENEWTVDILF